MIKTGFILTCIIFAVCAYLIGGMNMAIVLSNTIYHRDIRTLGSGNPGFTNFKRVFGLNIAAIIVMLSDIIKAAIPACIAMLVFEKYFEIGKFGAAFTGFFVMLGHCFPIWYKFKGGKAFMSGFGTIWFVDWKLTIICMIIFLFILFVFKYMSVASCTASISFPILLSIFGNVSISVIILSFASALLIILRHKENFKKLITGTESKFKIF